MQVKILLSVGFVVQKNINVKISDCNISLQYCIFAMKGLVKTFWDKGVKFKPWIPPEIKTEATIMESITE